MACQVPHALGTSSATSHLNREVAHARNVHRTPRRRRCRRLHQTPRSWATKSSTTSSSTATKGGIYPVNPTAPEILGKKAYPSVLECPDPVDLAVILVPNKAVPGVLEQCGQRGLKGAVIITAGFREVGPAGKALEQQVIDIAKRYGMRMIGPNVLGIIDTVLKLNASFAAGMPGRGKIAFMSQSGALCTSILDLALGQGIGFSRFYSIGNKADINELDLVQCLGRRSRDAGHHGATSKASPTGRSSSASPARSPATSRSSRSSRARRAPARRPSPRTPARWPAPRRPTTRPSSSRGIIRAGSVQDLFDYRPGLRPPAAARRRRHRRHHQRRRPRHHGLRRHRARRPAPGAADATRPSRRSRRSCPPRPASPTRSTCWAMRYADRYALAIEAALEDPNVDAV